MIIIITFMYSSAWHASGVCTFVNLVPDIIYNAKFLAVSPQSDELDLFYFMTSVQLIKSTVGFTRQAHCFQMWQRGKSG